MGNIKKFAEFLNEAETYAASVKRLAASFKSRAEPALEQAVMNARNKISQLEKQQDTTGDDKAKREKIQVNIDKQKAIIEAVGRVRTSKTVQKKN